MKKTLLTLFLMISFIGYSQTFTDNYITYNITYAGVPQTVEITNYDIAGGSVVDIPATVDYNSISYTVNKIDDNAFLSKSLTSVTIPSSIIIIGYSAFQGNALTSVTIPDSVVSLGNIAFLNNQLTNVTLSNNLGTIGVGVFQGNSITDVLIPNSVTTIQSNAFYINLLTTITIPENVVLISGNAFNGNPLTNIISENISPPSVTRDPTNDSFSSNRSNINLLIPIGSSSAYNTYYWGGFNAVTEDVEVGDNYVSGFITYEITSTANGTAKAVDYDVAGGSSVTIPATIQNGLITYTVTTIDINAFNNKNLTDITITNGITTIGSNSFRSNQLITVIIPSSVTTINQEAFYGNQLTSVVIPDTVTSLGGNAFAFNELTSVTFPNTITSIPLGLFQHNQLASVTIPNHITSIDAAAFENNLLTTVTIPSNVTNIAARAFKDNPLTSVISENMTPPTIITQNAIYDTFAADRSGIDLTIPAGTIDAYVTNVGALWTGFNSVNVTTLSASDFELANNIKVITTSDMIKISASNNISLEDYELYTISGMKATSGRESEFSTESLSKGIYILRLNFNTGTTTKKVLIN